MPPGIDGAGEASQVEPAARSVESVGGCVAGFIGLALFVLFAGGAISSLKVNPGSLAGWVQAVLALVCLRPLFRRGRPQFHPEDVAERRRWARALQTVGWIESGFQTNRYPEEVPAKPDNQGPKAE